MLALGRTAQQHRNQLHIIAQVAADAYHEAFVAAGYIHTEEVRRLQFLGYCSNRMGVELAYLDAGGREAVYLRDKKRREDELANLLRSSLTRQVLLRLPKNHRPFDESFAGGRGVGWVLVDEHDVIIEQEATRSWEEIIADYIANKRKH